MQYDSDGFGWLVGICGNSRFHWGRVGGSDPAIATWETPHLTAAQVRDLVGSGFDFAPWGVDGTINPDGVAIASVVPSQLALWERYQQVEIVTLDRVPLQQLYPTLGIDRALAVLGAGTKFGFPVLVIDGGTALTLTGANGDRALVGGAILPGLGLQLSMLSQNTAQLPDLNLSNFTTLPPRWATDTPNAIYSGILRTIAAGIGDFISDWRRSFPDSAIVFTGGDGDRLLALLKVQLPDLAAGICLFREAAFLGILNLVSSHGY